jgi:hypothetical protein
MLKMSLLSELLEEEIETVKKQEQLKKQLKDFEQLCKENLEEENYKKITNFVFTNKQIICIMDIDKVLKELNLTDEWSKNYLDLLKKKANLLKYNLWTQEFYEKYKKLSDNEKDAFLLFVDFKSRFRKLHKNTNDSIEVLKIFVSNENDCFESLLKIYTEK